jgi:hypothetical protein
MSLRPLKSYFFLLTLLFFFGCLAWHAIAGNAIQCHCFANRTYNPAKKFEADDYILATCFNSLLARLADLPKKQIVMIKMNEGVSQDDLLIGLKIAKITGQTLQNVLDLRRRNNSWAEIITALQPHESIDEGETLRNIRSGGDVGVIGAMVADEMIAEFFKISSEKIDKLRMSGLSEKEITLILILNHVSEIQPEALVLQYKNQQRSWSEIAHNLGLEPKAAGRLILAYPSKTIPAND